MYTIESRNVLTPQNGLNLYRGRTENSILLTETPGADPMDIGVKYDAYALLDTALRNRRSKCVIMMGNLGDPYNPLEKEYKLTRKCLKVIENNDFGVIITTRQNLILRDMDVITGISAKTRCLVELTFPSLDDEKLKKIEGEDTLSIEERLELLQELKKAGIEVIATLYPMIPYVNDDENELMGLLQELKLYGVSVVDLVDLRVAVKKSAREFFYTEYEKRFPEQYRRFISENENKGELLAADYRNKLKRVSELCERFGLMYDSRKIKAWKRQYENRTVGRQMELEDYL